MKKLVLMVIVLLFSCNIAFADEIKKGDTNRWTCTDTGLELSYATVHIMDWAQTRYMSRHYSQYYETNRILGRYPHRDKIDLYMGATLIAHAAIAYYLPKHYTVFGIDTYPRNLWQMVWIGLEVGTVKNNASIGLQYRF